MDFQVKDERNFVNEKAKTVLSEISNNEQNSLFTSIDKIASQTSKEFLRGFIRSNC